MKMALRTSELAVHHGGVRALDGVDIEVGPGEVVGLIGPNGAGKTTFIDAVSGFAEHRGRVLLGDRDIGGLAPHERARAGVARTWQSADLFDDLTVRQHCAVAATETAPTRRWSRWWSRTGSAASDADRVLDLLGLAGLGDVRPTELSTGQQKLVGVARALSARPTYLLLDEPAAGLDTAESEALGRRLRALVEEAPDRGAALGILLVDHDTGLVFEICDRVVVLDFGRVIASGNPAAVRSDPAVVDAYLGTAS